MKADASEFAKAANRIKRFVGNDSVTTVALEATGHELQMSAAYEACGGRVGLRAIVPATGKDTWQHRVPAGTFARCVGATSAKGYEEVTLTSAESVLRWKALGASLKFNSGPMASVGGGPSKDEVPAPVFEFDDPPYADAARVVIPDCAPLCAALKEAVVFTSRDESRPILTAVYVAQVEGEGADPRLVLDVVGVDFYRLYRRRLALPPEVVLPAGLKALLPGAFCQQLTKKTSDLALWFHSESEEVLAANAQVGGATWYGRALEGPFVNYPKVIPNTYAWEMRLDLAETQDVLRAALPVAAEDGNRIVLTPKGGKLIVRAEAADSGEFTGSIVIGEVAGEPGEIALSVKYALDFLELLDAAQPVTLQGNSAPEALSWTGRGRDPEHDAAPPLYVQMPMEVM